MITERFDIPPDPPNPEGRPPKGASDICVGWRNLRTGAFSVVRPGSAPLPPYLGPGDGRSDGTWIPVYVTRKPAFVEALRG